MIAGTVKRYISRDKGPSPPSTRWTADLPSYALGRRIIGLPAARSNRGLGFRELDKRGGAGPILTLLDRAGPVEAPIPSRWQHDAVPPWRRVPAELV